MESKPVWSIIFPITEFWPSLMKSSSYSSIFKAIALKSFDAIESLIPARKFSARMTGSTSSLPIMIQRLCNMNENANLFSEFLVAHLIYLLQEYPSISGGFKKMLTRTLCIRNVFIRKNVSIKHVNLPIELNYDIYLKFYYVIGLYLYDHIFIWGSILT